MKLLWTYEEAVALFEKAIRKQRKEDVELKEAVPYGVNSKAVRAVLKGMGLRGKAWKEVKGNRPLGWDKEALRYQRAEVEDSVIELLEERYGHEQDAHVLAELWADYAVDGNVGGFRVLARGEDEAKYGYVPTPGLREKVLGCVERLVKQGWRLTRDTYVDGRQQCCAIGAISVCAGNEDDDSRDVVVALSAKHLGCHPFEVDCIEAGFMGWDFRETLNAADEEEPTFFKVTSLDEEAVKVGKEIAMRYL